jgi:hypothetical protein
LCDVRLRVGVASGEEVRGANGDDGGSRRRDVEGVSNNILVAAKDERAERGIGERRKAAATQISRALSKRR